jgi:hypothetical protein
MTAGVRSQNLEARNVTRPPAYILLLGEQPSGCLDMEAYKANGLANKSERDDTLRLAVRAHHTRKILYKEW